MPGWVTEWVPFPSLFSSMFVLPVWPCLDTVTVTPEPPALAAETSKVSGAALVMPPVTEMVGVVLSIWVIFTGFVEVLPSAVKVRFPSSSWPTTPALSLAEMV